VRMTPARMIDIEELPTNQTRLYTYHGQAKERLQPNPGGSFDQS
jgi:hypothetical protein